MSYFFPKEKVIDYYRLYSDGINGYTELQRKGIAAILQLEEKIIKREKIPPVDGYISFNRIMEKSRYGDSEQYALKQVRNALLHYNMRFGQNDFEMFVKVMERDGICRGDEWVLRMKK